MTVQTHEVSKAVERAARLGYAAKGVVYLIVGGLAAMAAFGSGGATTGSEGALYTVMKQPFGRALLSVLALGLAGYTVWRLIQGVKDPENNGAGSRIYALGSAVLHGSLTLAAARIVFRGIGTSGSGSDTEGMVAQAMAQPFGTWLVGIAGLITLFAAGHQFHQAATGGYRKRLGIGRLGPTASTWVSRAAKTGLTARGFVFGIIGIFFLVAAWQTDPSEAKGFGEALQTVQAQTYGPWLLGAVAIGLVGYGVYQMVKAKYRYFG